MDDGGFGGTRSGTFTTGTVENMNTDGRPSDEVLRMAMSKAAAAVSGELDEESNGFAKDNSTPSAFTDNPENTSMAMVAETMASDLGMTNDFDNNRIPSREPSPWDQRHLAQPPTYSHRATSVPFSTSAGVNSGYQHPMVRQPGLQQYRNEDRYRATQKQRSFANGSQNNVSFSPYSTTIGNQSYRSDPLPHGQLPQQRSQYSSQSGSVYPHSISTGYDYSPPNYTPSVAGGHPVSTEIPQYRSSGSSSVNPVGMQYSTGAPVSTGGTSSYLQPSQNNQMQNFAPPASSAPTPYLTSLDGMNRQERLATYRQTFERVAQDKNITPAFPSYKGDKHEASLLNNTPLGRGDFVSRKDTVMQDRSMHEPSSGPMSTYQRQNYQDRGQLQEQQYYHGFQKPKQEQQQQRLERQQPTHPYPPSGPFPTQRNLRRESYVDSESQRRSSFYRQNQQQQSQGQPYHDYLHHQQSQQAGKQQSSLPYIHTEQPRGRTPPPRYQERKIVDPSFQMSPPSNEWTKAPIRQGESSHASTPSIHEPRGGSRREVKASIFESDLPQRNLHLPLEDPAEDSTPLDLPPPALENPAVEEDPPSTMLDMRKLGGRWQYLGELGERERADSLNKPYRPDRDPITDVACVVRSIIKFDERMNQTVLGSLTSINRSMISNFLNGKVKGDRSSLEGKLARFIYEYATGKFDSKKTTDSTSSARPPSTRSTRFRGLVGSSKGMYETSNLSTSPSLSRDPQAHLLSTKPTEVVKEYNSFPHRGAPSLSNRTLMEDPSGFPNGKLLRDPEGEKSAIHRNSSPDNVERDIRKRPRTSGMELDARKRQKIARIDRTAATNRAFQAFVMSRWVGDYSYTPPLLLPMSIDVEVGGKTLRTTIQWQVGEKRLSPEHVAEMLRRREGLPEDFTLPVAQYIRLRLAEAGILCPPPPFRIGMENRHRVRICVQLPYPDVSKYLTKNENLNSSGAEVPKGVVLEDEFEWDLGMEGLNDPRHFAASLCADLHLDERNAPAVAQAISKELLKLQKASYAEYDASVDPLPQVDGVIIEQSPAEQEAVRLKRLESMIETEIVEDLIEKVYEEHFSRKRAREAKQREEAERKKEQKEEEEKMREEEIFRKEEAYNQAELQRLDGAVSLRLGVNMSYYTARRLGRGKRPSVFLPALGGTFKSLEEEDEDDQPLMMEEPLIGKEEYGESAFWKNVNPSVTSFRSTLAHSSFEGSGVNHVRARDGFRGRGKRVGRPRAGAKEGNPNEWRYSGTRTIVNSNKFVPFGAALEALIEHGSPRENEFDASASDGDQSTAELRKKLCRPGRRRRGNENPIAETKNVKVANSVTQPAVSNMDGDIDCGSVSSDDTPLLSLRDRKGFRNYRISKLPVIGNYGEDRLPRMDARNCDGMDKQEEKQHLVHFKGAENTNGTATDESASESNVDADLENELLAITDGGIADNVEQQSEEISPQAREQSPEEEDEEDEEDEEEDEEEDGKEDEEVVGRRSKRNCG